MAGNYSKRLGTPTNCSFADFSNPWNFYSLFLLPREQHINWLRENGLPINSLTCPKCQGDCSLGKRKNNVDGETWGCKKNRNHEFSIRQNSFFDKSHFKFPDILIFIKNFLDGQTLYKCAQFSGLDYKRTSIYWANFIRDLFRQWMQDNIINLQFTDEVEIDESLFGRRVKFHRGNPNVGVKVWVVGLIERKSNRLLLFPFDHRNEGTLTSIIETHVAPGTTIYTDGWGGYRNLKRPWF